MADSGLVSTAMLMAAGLGTRLRPFTEHEPKALIPMMGVPMAQFALDALSAAGVSRTVANVHHLAQKARAGLQALEKPADAELLISDETELLLGSAGGLKKAQPLLGKGPFFLVNADTLCDVDLATLAERHMQLRARFGVTITLTVFPRPPNSSSYREVIYDETSGLVTGLGESRAARPFFVGVAVVEPEALSVVPQVGPADFVPTILAPAIAAKKAGIFLASGNWFDVGSPELWLNTHLSLIRALETGPIHESWRRRIEKANLRIANEVWMAHGGSRDFDPSLWTGPCYWSQGASAGRAPQNLGPGAVLYGEPVNQTGNFMNGIGAGGIWRSISS